MLRARGFLGLINIDGLGSRNAHRERGRIPLSCLFSQLIERRPRVARSFASRGSSCRCRRRSPSSARFHSAFTWLRGSPLALLFHRPRLIYRDRRNFCALHSLHSRRASADHHGR